MLFFRVVLEIFSTEQTYVKNLECLYNDFLVPLERAKQVHLSGLFFSFN